MKTLKALILSCAVIGCMFVSTESNAQSNNLNDLIGKARAELNSCLSSFRPVYDIIASAGTFNCVTEPCPYAYVVEFYADPVCQPNGRPCLAIPTIQVATVYFDADRNIVEIRDNCPD